jgi:putative tryptophan/tyrosine transport system substrate-binding protein
MMRRREFITLLGSATAAWPPAARAQQATMPVVGFLHSAAPGTYGARLAAFRQGLKEAGYVEGENVSIEYRWAEDRYERSPAMADDLVRRQVTVIFANGPMVRSAKAATTTIPIVFTVGYDPIQLGLVASLSRPGGNLTGVSILNVELGPKRLELVRELVPAATTAAVLVNPTNHNADVVTRDMRAAGHALGLQIHILQASNESELEAAFADLVRTRAAALVIGADPFFNTRSQQLAALSLRHAVPAIFQYREFFAAGGLMSYGGSLTDVYRQAGVYVGRILKGERPGDLPVQQSTKIELMINLKTAKTLGLTVPLPLLGRADEVIE